MAGQVWISGRRMRPAFPAEADQGAFLKQEELQDGTALGLFVVRATRVGEHPVYVIGGRRLDKTFLAGLDMPVGMRALLYQNRGDHFSPELLIDPSTLPLTRRALRRKAAATDRCGAAVWTGNDGGGAVVWRSGRG